MKRLLSVATTSVICIALLGSGRGPSALAAGTPTATPTLNHTYGKIVEINAGRATLLTNAGKSAHIKLGEKTRFTARSFAAAAAGLKVGEFARATGGDDADSAPARTFFFGLEDFGKPRQTNNQRIRGTVTFVQGNDLQIRDAGKDPVAVKLLATTKYFVAGKPVSSRPNLQLGTRVRILVHREVDNSLNALEVHVVKASTNAQIKGTVVLSSGNSLTIRDTDRDPVAVRLLATTKYLVNSTRVPARPTFMQRQAVQILVHREADDSLDALTVSLTTQTT